MFFYLFLMIPSTPLDTFVSWDYSILFWFCGGVTTCLACVYRIPYTSIRFILYLMYGSLVCLLLSYILRAILESTRAIGWVGAFALVAGIQLGLFTAAGIQLYRHGQTLRRQGVMV
jgi:hypothetical protein